MTASLKTTALTFMIAGFAIYMLGYFQLRRTDLPVNQVGQMRTIRAVGTMMLFIGVGMALSTLYNK